jgi:hypothetical protein
MTEIGAETGNLAAGATHQWGRGDRDRVRRRGGTLLTVQSIGVKKKGKEERGKEREERKKWWG